MLRFYVEDPQTADGGGTSCPELALLITTYQKPRHLRLVLASVALQQDVEGLLEVIVVDDGSTDETIQVAERFARSVDFPVRMTTHRHRAFQVARCRNEGVAASTAPYLVFIDGDCLVRPDFVAQHLRRRKRRIVMNGDCHRLEEDVSAGVDEAVVRSGRYVQWASMAERERLRRGHRRSRWQNLIRHRRKPHLLGNNIGVWREDYELINGFDEDFEGWGVEDDDLGYRFRQAGIRIKSIRPWTPTYHLWHPRDATWTPNWLDGQNAPRLTCENRLTRCRNGLLRLGPPASVREGAPPPDASDEIQILDFASFSTRRPTRWTERVAA